MGKLYINYQAPVDLCTHLIRIKQNCQLQLTYSTCFRPHTMDLSFPESGTLICQSCSLRSIIKLVQAEILLYCTSQRTVQEATSFIHQNRAMGEFKIVQPWLSLLNGHTTVCQGSSTLRQEVQKGNWSLKEFSNTEVHFASFTAPIAFFNYQRWTY